MNHREKIAGFIVEQGRLSADVVNQADFYTQPLFTTGFLDSVQFMELVEIIEQEINVKIDEEDLLAKHFDTVNSIVSLIEKYKHRKINFPKKDR